MLGVRSDEAAELCMWWVPLIAAGLIGATLLALHGVHQRRQASGAKAYRRRFIQLVAQLELVTTNVNQLGLQVHQVKEPRLLDYCEGTLRILETLLGAMRKIPPFGTDLGTLDAAVFLVKDCRQRVARITKAFAAINRGEEPNLNELFMGEAQGQGKSGLKVTGCYFCSRPVIVERFAEVRVRLDGAAKDVISCKTCRDQLSTSRKVKVLHFIFQGKPLHWSQVPDYKPSEEFWGINKTGDPLAAGLTKLSPAKARHLVLVQPATEAHHPE